MPFRPSPSALLLPFAVAASLSAALRGQEGVPQPPGLVPEQMWYAPTAADWQKPVAIRWQRTWEDAVRLSQQTKRPILVCVNMDGEIASEHYAGVRYRDPEIAKLWEPYVCVIASVYRHTPRDHDDQGRRIPCPRLGTVTCGEHIALEPLVYEKFLDGKRISPRHIMVELDGSEVYDVFYTWDTKSVFDTLRDGIQKRQAQTQPIVRGDRSLKEKIESPDSQDREEIEQLFAKADAQQRAAMLAAALGAGDKAPIELLRQAAFGLDPDLAQKARQGMLVAADPNAVELIADTLQAPMAADERQALAKSLRRFASSRAQSLAAAHAGLADGKTAILIFSGIYAAGAMRWGLIEMIAYGIILTILALVLAPHVGLFLLSIATVWSFSPLPDAYTLAHYGRVLSESGQFIWNTLLYATLAGLIGIGIGTAISYLVLRTRIPGREWLDYVASAALAVPGVVLGIGYLRTYFGVTMPGGQPLTSFWIIIVLALAVRRMPYALRACMAAMQQISVSLEEAAENLGASKASTIRRIVMPLMTGGLLAGFVTSFATAAVELSATMMLVQNTADAPLAYGLYVFMQSPAGRGAGAALGIIAVLIVGISTYLSQSLAERDRRAKAGT